MTENYIQLEDRVDVQSIRRTKITQLMEGRNIKGLEEFGIHVIDEEQPPGEDCYKTAFPSRRYPKDILVQVLTKWDSVTKPDIGDVALYINKRLQVTHVGRAINDGKVRSRWGKGGFLCEHPPLDLPLFAGLDIEVSWFREPKGTTMG